MIAFLRGMVAEKLEQAILLDVHGVGYGVTVTSEAHNSISVGQEAHLTIYENIKEDSHDLYGFLDKGSRSLFELLIGVNGVGPKMGINIMNIGSAPQLRAAIASGDVKYISAASGVGKKLAERVVLDLKDKMGIESSDNATSFISIPASTGDEAVQALAALGFTPQDAAQALEGVDPGLDTEERIKLALRGRR